MDINEKILWQLADMLRSAGSGSEAISLTLPFIAWWKIQEKGLLPQHLHLEEQLGKELVQIIESLSQVQSHAPASFIDEGAYKLLDTARDLFPLLKKVVELGKQGLLNAFSADDICYWAADRNSPQGLAPTLADLVIALLDPADGCSVYAPWEHSGQLAARARRIGYEVLVETPLPLLAAQVLTLTSLDQWQVLSGDPIHAPRALEHGRLKRFASSIAVPPMGVRYDREVVDSDLFGRFTEKTVSGSVLQLQHLMAQTAGRVIAVVPNSVLFSVGAERSFRKELFERGAIEAVISLPSGLLTGSAIPTSVLVLNTKKQSQQIHFVNADSEQFCTSATKKRAELTQIDVLVKLARGVESSPSAVSVQPEQVRSNDFNLEVGRYVLDDAAQKLEQILADLPLARLGEHVEIIRSRQHSTSSSGVAVREVQASDIPDFGAIVSASKDSLFDLSSPKAKTYFLQAGDILLAIKGSVGKVGIVPQAPPAGEGGWVAGQSFVVLRSLKDASYESKALLVYLRSEIGQALLSRLVVGASMPTIQLASLKDLGIPSISQEAMSTASEILEHEVRIQQEIQQLRSKQASLASALWTL
ncbi:N-6 DNA methylase [Pseudomonas aeruginosa]|uniref:N-6 DNA methylase n=1 Tax=Pseudomonas TaxID=286 RepID=UPI0007EE4AA2|nr:MULTISPECIES: N-6 DNA methylase [Pseudomonas]MBX6555603.1 N-6 DNA methylase [Pseudomonas aeruginosa]MBX6587678.1 N-6 DNA methylase [Pseudomonas aeruginosa]MBX6605486.1 N-6 DNA methylase [Pseudomonas aeruginosa]MBX6617910.1 N-6 DNA methylase [Pseudomonas aeruginosa]MBX6881099.1 N-6 DNA methylase [Pseudomonas aeruginosa]